ncbi:glycosyltransferase [Enterococcus sp. S86.2]|uniref:glycosyltransferase n=1 Tax=Enterococcus sp. S86.2 TaxID=3031299 RepID=UPI0026EF5CC4|nr:glycosyltransferase [Enterococcus sp. S86.2]
MKVLFLSSAKDIHTCRWVNELVNQGISVDLVYCSNHDVGIHYIDERVICHRLPFQSGLGYYLNVASLKRIIKNINPDIINAHYASGYGTLLRYAKFNKNVLSVWGADVYDFPYNSKISMRIIKKNLRYADVICSTSKSMAKQVHSLIGENKKIYITPFGVDVEKFKEKINYFDNPKGITIGIVKRLEPKYGVRYLIEAMKIIVHDFGYHNVFLEIYGEGSEKNELIKLSKKMDLDRHVFFKGVVENSAIPKILSGFDLFAVSSILDSESFGVSVVEAMATALPIVATDVSGFVEVINNSVNGIIVPKKQPTFMAEAIKELIDNKTRAIRLGKNARKKVLKEYNFSNNVEDMIRIYRKVCNE